MIGRLKPTSLRLLRQLRQLRQASETPPQLSWVPARGDRREAEGIGIADAPSSPSSHKERGASGRAARLTFEAEELIERLLPSEEQERQRDDMVQDLRRRIRAELPRCDLVTFGSAATGLWLPGRDVDLSLQVPGLRGRIETKQVLHRVASLIHGFSGDKPENRLAAKMPLLRWVPQAILPSCDITVNNDLAVENSRLVTAYLMAEPLLRKLLIVIKTWAFARGINDRSEGTLSSFALTLMVVHLLQRRQRLPSLQDLAILHGLPRREVQQVDCRFCTDSAILEKERAKFSSPSLGACLMDFFKFYGTEYKGGIVSIRNVDGNPPSWASGKFLFIDNPFEPGKDVANVELGQLARLREELRKAHSALRRGKSVEELCQQRSWLARDVQESKRGSCAGDDVDFFASSNTSLLTSCAVFFFHAVSSLDMPSPQGGGEVCSSHTVRADQRDSGVLPESESLQ
ncbi:unnamed protein product, partial [Effrenium voratum]